MNLTKLCKFFKKKIVEFAGLSMPSLVFTKTRTCALDTYKTIKKNLKKMDRVRVYRFTRASLITFFTEGDFCTAALEVEDLKACFPLL